MTSMPINDVVDLNDAKIDAKRPAVDHGRRAEDPRVVHPLSDVPDDDQHYQQRLGARLRAVRQAKGLRLQDVEDASRGRFKAVVVGSYERGDRAVSAHKLAALASFYGVAAADLLPDPQRPRDDPREVPVTIVVDRMREQADDSALAPLVRLVEHVQWMRGDLTSQHLALRSDDLRTVAVALGIEPDELHLWLQTRGLLAG